MLRTTLHSNTIIQSLHTILIHTPKSTPQTLNSAKFCTVKLISFIYKYTRSVTAKIPHTDTVVLHKSTKICA